MSDKNEDGGSLVKVTGVDAGNLGEAAKELIQAIRAGIGVFWEPKRIVRKAKAEAEAAMIAAESSIKLSELQQRALQRLVHVESSRQANIEAITGHAVKLLPEAGKAPPQDWIVQFFGECQDVSDEQMQELWGYLLANEVVEPGSFSRRTLSTLRVMSFEDAGLFALLRPLSWFDPVDKVFMLMLHGINNMDVERFGLRYSALMHLESLGLIKTSLTDITLVPTRNPMTLEYFDKTFEIGLTPPSDRFVVGKALLTQTGTELMGLCGGTPNVEYRDDALARIMREGATVRAIE